MEKPSDPPSGGAGAANAAGPSALPLPLPPSTGAKNKGKGVATKTPTEKTSAKRKPSANQQAGIETRKRSPAWTFFNEVPRDQVSERTAECKYCRIRFLCGSKGHGTSNMLAHMDKCPKYPYALASDPKQQVLDFERSGNKTTLVGSMPHVCDIEECRKAIAVFVIVDEQPFKVVEGFGFKHMMKKCQPQLNVPSRITVARDCLKLYIKEKDRLKALLKSNCSRVCLTTDCWTSVQNLNYMVLTAHFIDKEWNLQKRILNFCLIANHKGETIGKQIEICLNEWGLKRVCTVTVDNASSNDGAIAYLKKKLKNWKGLVMNGEFMHVRCCAHILNLVVNEGLKDLHTSISAIRNAVRYVRSSPSRLSKFKDAIAQEHITHKALVCLDVPTRWNSTYMMLAAAEKFQKAFERLEDDDTDYLLHFRDDDKREGPPTNDDWNNARAFINFLKIFYDVTLSLSGSLYVTSNTALIHLTLVQSEIYKWTKEENCDSVLYFMGMDMKKKYDKYWGKIENMNPLIFIANALDPRYKLAYMKWSFEEIYGEDVAESIVKRVKNEMGKLYEWYASEYGQPINSSNDAVGSFSVGGAEPKHTPAHIARTAAFRNHLRQKDTIEAKNELERYLNESCELEDHKFDVLAWWKSNESRFLILSKMARDLLAVPVSTVASESAFSTGGRVLDVFRSSLSTKTVEALICTQNWLTPTKFNFQEPGFMEDLEKIEEIEEELMAATTKPSTSGGSIKIGNNNGAKATSSGNCGAQQEGDSQQPMAVD